MQLRNVLMRDKDAARRAEPRALIDGFFLLIDLVKYLSQRRVDIGSIEASEFVEDRSVWIDDIRRWEVGGLRLIVPIVNQRAVIHIEHDRKAQLIRVPPCNGIGNCGAGVKDGTAAGNRIAMN